MMKAFQFLIIAACLAATCTAAAGQTPSPSPARSPLPSVRIGPPAPVPPAVEMLRPSSAELTELNTALKRWIASDKSKSAAALRKYEPLILLQPPRLNTAATFTQTTQRMGPRHEG